MTQYSVKMTLRYQNYETFDADFSTHWLIDGQLWLRCCYNFIDGWQVSNRSSGAWLTATWVVDYALSSRLSAAYIEFELRGSLSAAFLTVSYLFDSLRCMIDSQLCGWLCCVVDCQLCRLSAAFLLSAAWITVSCMVDCRLSLSADYTRMRIDFSINGLSTGGLFKDVNITKDTQHRRKLK